VLRKMLLLYILFVFLFVWTDEVMTQAPTTGNFEVESSVLTSVAFHTRPGLVSFKGGKWVGNEHLLGLSKGIRIVAEIVKPKGVSIGLTSEKLRTQAELKVREVGVDPDPKINPQQTVLPFLHILVLVYPVEGGFAASCNVRLFEGVELSRAAATQTTKWQAITWEQQTLIVFPKSKIGGQIQNSVQEILGAFGKRYAFYLRLQKYIRQK